MLAVKSKACTLEYTAELPQCRFPELAAFLHEHCWDPGYEFNFVSEFVSRACYVLCATTGSPDSGEIVGCALNTRFHGCPDDHSDENLWFCGWTVRPGLQGAGLGTRLYEGCMRHALSSGDKHIFATTDHDKASRTLVSRQRGTDKPWEFVRYGKNEDKTPMRVWRRQV